MSEQLVNVIDVEATCWSGQPPAGQVSQIIEIGLCVVDLAARERVANRGILVRPTRSTVSAFCTELTSLTQVDVDSGMTFAEACTALVGEEDSANRVWLSWGDYDRKQFHRDCQGSGVAYPFGRHINLKAAYTDAYDLPRRPGMAAALHHAGLPLEGRHHRGVDDARNIAALLLHMLADGHDPVATHVDSVS
ncbi:3'-5' exonuclease [Longispora fulva]|uniref:Inhibitor of KinA sporulation pathway (Predicted exonuclease) n=1 Tax=Longispora fulva TaxID=619741 RepID=A0A8J7GMH0_9ACTN|nr:3'-5' exonuclease [Longispora fulva]MBG6134323.1 inhibitor of KinA sporulation pathway (predicted exonuclease) [Longispora fulva]